MFYGGALVELITNDYNVVGLYPGNQGIVMVAQVGAATGGPYSLVSFPGHGDIAVYNHHMKMVDIAHQINPKAEESPKDNKQQFVDKEAMWEAIKSISKGQ